MEAYEINFPGYMCLRCGHKWPALNPGKPRTCPKCRSPYWDTARKGTEKPNYEPQFSREKTVITQKPIQEVKEITPNEIQITDEVRRISEMDKKPKVTADTEDKMELKCFNCAQAKGFDCAVQDKYVKTAILAPEKPFCSVCVVYDFWSSKNVFKEVTQDKVDEPQIVFGEAEDPDDIESLKKQSYACNLKVKTPNGIVMCPYKDRALVTKNYCPLCWELEEIWGEQAVGYKERRERNK